MGSKQHILVAEDNPNDLLLLRRAFQKASVPVELHVVADGAAAIAYLSGTKGYEDRDNNPLPQLVLLDIKMPKLTGLEVLEWLKEHPEHQVIPTIIMSCSNLEEDVRKSYQLGANTFFVKPNQMETLVQIIEALTQYWQSARKPET